MTRRRVLAFTDPRSGERRQLRNPDAEGTGRQLARLNRAGQLEIVAPGAVEPITTGEAAAAIDDAAPLPFGGWLLQQVCRDDDVGEVARCLAIDPAALAAADAGAALDQLARAGAYPEAPQSVRLAWLEWGRWQASGNSPDDVGIDATPALPDRWQALAAARERRYGPGAATL